MAKRKLSRQQAWRIEKIRAERARRAAKSPWGQVPSGPDPTEDMPATEEREGVITAHYGTQVEVEAQTGGGQRQSARCHLRANLDGMVTGDRVVFCPGEPMGVVVAQLPRTTELRRPDAYGKLKAIAANIDQIAVVIAPLPTPHANLLDRYLVAAQETGARPLIVVNKCDLLADPALAAPLEEMLKVYPPLGYPVIRCSIHSGLAELEDALRGCTSVFVGQSGVGKTSLLNALLPGAAPQRTGALSEGSGKGTHTTTTSGLFHLPGGGHLIDSPGIREFGLGHLTRHAVESGFREFHPYLDRCRFRDCRHQSEPGCALLAAVADGLIPAQRLASYRHIIGSLDAS